MKKEKRKASDSPPNTLAQFPEGFVESFRFHDDRRSPVKTRSLSARSELSPSKGGVEVKEKKEEDVDEEHLPFVPDHCKEDVDILFIGSNPGRMSSIKSQHFSHPSNHFYRTLYRSGLTPKLVAPKDDFTMLEQRAPLFSLGLTNLAARPTRMAQEVKREENVAGTSILLALMRLYRPKIGVFIGLGVARSFEQNVREAVHPGGVKVEVDERMETIVIPANVPVVGEEELGVGVGLLPIAVRHDLPIIKKEEENESSSTFPFTLLFASPSTSGRVTSHQLPDKTECMRRVRTLMEFLADRQDSSHTSETKMLSVRIV